MAHRLSLTAVYEVVDDGWTQARIEEIPGVITAAPSRAEAQDLLLDALREYLLSFQSEPHAGANHGAAETGVVEILLSA